MRPLIVLSGLYPYGLDQDSDIKPTRLDIILI